ncbi:MAG: enoyl-CoA hydratase-related protein, partial [Mycobacteriaceae bacterium]
MTVTHSPDTTATAQQSPKVTFDRQPAEYKHWKIDFDGPIATLTLTVDPFAGLVPGYELKMNSYDLGVDIELYDATQRLRFEHPEVKAVVVTSGVDKMFCAGANIRMLAQSPHSWKVNFCKFTNETRNGIEDSTENSGQTYIAAVNGTAAGGGYELVAACDEVVLIDDGSSAVSLPEIPLLGVLPGTGGLTRVVDKRKVRKDRADMFATRSEGVRGATAVQWGLVDETAPRARFDEAVKARAQAAVATSKRPSDAHGVHLIPLERTETDSTISYRYVEAKLDRENRRVDITVRGPESVPPTDGDAAVEQGANYYPLQLTRELDDAILLLRTNENELGTWVFRIEGDPGKVLAYDQQLEDLAEHWFISEVRHYYKRTIKRLDVTSRSLFSVIEPGSANVGFLFEITLAADRQYMLDGVYEDAETRATPAYLQLTAANFGSYPMGNGLNRVHSRFWGHDDDYDRAKGQIGAQLVAGEADEYGLVTSALDDIDFE